MQEIAVSIQRVTAIMTDISTASIEQNSGISQVNQAIAQMDDVTQQNAALVEQAAAAAESMEEQTQSLSDMMAVFKIDKKIPVPIAQHTVRVVEATKSGKNTASVKPVYQSSVSEEWEEF
jgi:methyl-accepting chemotaxis protein